MSEHDVSGGSAAAGAGSPRSAAKAGAPEGTRTLFHRPRARARGMRLRTLVVCLASAALLLTLVVAGLLGEDAALSVNFSAKNLSPCPAHPFGTDWMGRDMFMRTVCGLKTSILVGLLAAGASSLIALVLGAAAALGGRKLDAAISWLVDLMLGIPHIVLLILISFALGRGFWGVAVGVALTHWPSLARVLRAEILQCKQAAYLTVAEKLGRGRVHRALHHVLPYVVPQFLIGLILMFPHAILHEAALTFLGFGLPPEQPAIGIILSESMAYLSAGMWWLAVFPGAALIATALLFNEIGSGLRALASPSSSQD